MEEEQRRVADVLESLMNLDWTPQQRADFEAALPLAKSEANVAIAGVTGTGKSTLINALCGAITQETSNDTDTVFPAVEGKTLRPETKEITHYVAQTASFSGKSYSVIVWDSPGVKDGSGRENMYVSELKAKCGNNIDMLLYCVKVSVQRCIVREIAEGIKVITRTLGVDIWRHSMVVLTRANTLGDKLEKSIKPREGEADLTELYRLFQPRIEHWQKGVKNALLEAGLPDKIVQNIPIEPAGHYTNPHLPDRIHWLGYLWVLFFKYARDDAKFAILFANHHRIRDVKYLIPEMSPEDQSMENESPTTKESLIEEDVQAIDDHQPEKISSLPIVIASKHLSTTNLKVTAISMSVASGAGACAGGVAGGLVAGSLTAGLGTGVGLVAGAAAGAVIGPLIGMAVNKMLERRNEKETENRAK